MRGTWAPKLVWTLWKRKWNHGSSARPVLTEISKLKIYFIIVSIFPFTTRSFKWFLSFRLPDKILYTQSSSLFLNLVFTICNASVYKLSYDPGVPDVLHQQQSKHGLYIIRLFMNGLFNRVQRRRLSQTKQLQMLGRGQNRWQANYRYHPHTGLN